MRKLALALVASSSLVASSKAVVIYDSFFTDSSEATFQTVTDTGSTPRAMKGDFFTVRNYGPGETSYNVNTMSFLFLAWTTAMAGENLKAELNVYRTASGLTSGTGNSFSNNIFSNTYDLGAWTQNANTFVRVNLDTTGLVLDQADGNLYGVTIRFLQNDLVDNNRSAGLVNNTAGLPAPVNYVGASSNGWYRDVDSSGSIQDGEFRVFASPSMSNLAMNIDADPVPEPASMIALGAGALGVLARRRRKTA